MSCKCLRGAKKLCVKLSIIVKKIVEICLVLSGLGLRLKIYVN